MTLKEKYGNNSACLLIINLTKKNIHCHYQVSYNQSHISVHVYFLSVNFVKLRAIWQRPICTEPNQPETRKWTNKLCEKLYRASMINNRLQYRAPNENSIRWRCAHDLYCVIALNWFISLFTLSHSWSGRFGRFGSDYRMAATRTEFASYALPFSSSTLSTQIPTVTFFLQNITLRCHPTLLPTDINGGFNILRHALTKLVPEML